MLRVPVDPTTYWSHLHLRGHDPTVFIGFGPGVCFKALDTLFRRLWLIILEGLRKPQAKKSSAQVPLTNYGYAEDLDG